MKNCKKCKIDKDFNNFYKHNGYKDKLRPICIECFKKEKSEYQKTNKNRNSYFITYYSKEENKKKLQKYRDDFKNNNGYCFTTYLYRTNKFFKLRHNLRRRLRKSLKIKKWNKNTHFSKYIGCDKETLINHLESKFQNGMTWDNYGEWHIYHIIPLSSSKTEEELYKLCHYTNLQPLWATDNLKKSNT